MQHALGQASFGQQLRNNDAATDRGAWVWLNNNSIADGQRRRDRAHGEVEREVESLWVTFPAACGVSPMDEHLQTAIPRRLRRGFFIASVSDYGPVDCSRLASDREHWLAEWRVELERLKPKRTKPRQRRGSCITGKAGSDVCRRTNPCRHAAKGQAPHFWGRRSFACDPVIPLSAG